MGYQDYDNQIYLANEMKKDLNELRENLKGNLSDYKNALLLTEDRKLLKNYSDKLIGVLYPLIEQKVSKVDVAFQVGEQHIKKVINSIEQAKQGPENIR